MYRSRRYERDFAAHHRGPERVYGGRGLDEAYGSPSGGFRRPRGWDRAEPLPLPPRGAYGGRGDARTDYGGRYPHPFHGGMSEYYSGTHHGYGPIGQSSWEHGFTPAPGRYPPRGRR